MADETDRFSRAMSLAVHELRTPVTVVSGYLRMLLREQAGPINEKQRKMLEEVERSAARLAAIVSEMSDLGKLEAGELSLARQDVDIAALLAELASGMHEGEDRGVTLEVHGAATPVVVTGDRTRLASALKALLHSALRERGEPGTIIAECSRVVDEGVEYGVIAIGDAAVLASLRAAARGPAPGFDEWRGGMGVALPVARRVVEAHGGRLWTAAGTQSRAAAALRLPLRN